jgi:outer membrane lipoprotein SlyB
MKRLTASILALGLATGIGTASAQSSGYYSQYGQSDGYGSSYGQPNADRYGQVNGAYYDYARVVRADPVYDQSNRSGYGYPANGQRCYSQNGYADNGYNNGAYNNNGYNNNGYNSGYSNNGYRNDGYNNSYGSNGYGNQGSTAGRTVATVIGGVIGAALGSQVGGGSARYATSAIGSMVGGIAGQRVYENSHRQRLGTVQICDPVSDSNGYANNGYGQYGQVSNGRIVGYDVTYEYNGRSYTTRTSYNPGNRLRVRVDINPG